MSGRAAERNSFSSRWSRLMFDGDEKNYELWEAKFLGHLRLQDLKDVILNEPTTEEEDELQQDAGKNEEAYAELIQFLDDKSLSLVMRDAADDGRGALQILRNYYQGKGKPRIISLYTELTSLQKSESESVTEYVIRAETAITALRNAGETLSDGLLVAMVLKGLPESFKPFAIHVTQRDETMQFSEFKTKMRSYEDTEKMRAEADDNVMNVRQRRARPDRPTDRGAERSAAEVVCFKCGLKGHMARACRRKLWCSHCKSSTHRDATCRRKQRVNRDDARRVHGETEDHDRDEYHFVSEGAARVDVRGLMVDCGATSHIITDLAKFKRFDDGFQAETHCVELADGTRCKGVAERRGDAEVCLIDSTGRHLNATLRQALYIPSYPQDILSVKAATARGATVVFKEEKNVLIYQDGAVASDKAKEWVKAMDEEMHSLKENNTFTLTNLPEGKKAVGGRWVYAIKTDVDGSEKYKARYVAKGYSQKMGVDYGETFSPTANMTKPATKFKLAKFAGFMFGSN
ncbi:uncharacterized protein LOC133165345 [Syngnathus typhle]|uniref:uncharacterized protein LOC133165345 n=1 Tax=Syngnathus typhle TaxID=161592 RepID=UPI002A6B76FB|nr:uncharacterized protein LOC133165345 [Syngnathus typhle]